MGDECPKKCGGTVEEGNRLRLGNIFPLGTSYAEKMESILLIEWRKKASLVCKLRNRSNKDNRGSSGNFNDEKGIIWPKEIAPFKVHLIGLNKDAEDVLQETNRSKSRCSF